MDVIGGVHRQFIVVFREFDDNYEEKLGLSVGHLEKFDDSGINIKWDLIQPPHKYIDNNRDVCTVVFEQAFKKIEKTFPMFGTIKLSKYFIAMSDDSEDVESAFTLSISKGYENHTNAKLIRSMLRYKFTIKPKYLIDLKPPRETIAEDFDDDADKRINDTLVTNPDLLQRGPTNVENILEPAYIDNESESDSEEDESNVSDNESDKMDTDSYKQHSYAASSLNSSIIYGFQNSMQVDVNFISELHQIYDSISSGNIVQAKNQLSLLLSMSSQFKSLCDRSNNIEKPDYAALRNIYENTLYEKTLTELNSEQICRLYNALIAYLQD